MKRRGAEPQRKSVSQKGRREEKRIVQIQCGVVSVRGGKVETMEPGRAKGEVSNKWNPNIGQVQPY